MDRSKRALVVFSGGQDSTTCLFWAKERFDYVKALTFAYGQKHIIELESASKIAKMASVDHELVDLGPVFKGLSSLTDEDSSIPDYKEESEEESLPSTFVPGRNILFLSIAASRAYTSACDNIVIGVSQEDYAGYPDCRSAFIESMESSLSHGLDRKVAILSPLMNLSKKETVELAVNTRGALDALAFSTTCYNGQVPPCGSCNSCVLRARGFNEAQVEDPLVVRTQAKELADAGS